MPRFQRAYRFRAYPTPEQEQAIPSLLETHRRLYNRSLAERKDAYEVKGRTVTYGGQSAELKTERRENPYLAKANFASCQRRFECRRHREKPPGQIHAGRRLVWVSCYPLAGGSMCRC